MPDLDDLFQSSIAFEQRVSEDTAPMARPVEGSVAVAEPAPEPSALPQRRPPVDPDDVLLDLRELVAEWNAEHEAAARRVGDADEASAAPTHAAPAHDAAAHAAPAQDTPTHDPAAGPPPRRSRWRTARHVLADHIGAQPASRVEPPPGVVEDDDGTGAEPAVPPVLRPADQVAAAAEEVGDERLIPERNRQVRRRARKETDRLLRECTRTPGATADLTDEPPEVTLLAAPPAPAVLPEPVVPPAPAVSPDPTPPVVPRVATPVVAPVGAPTVPPVPVTVPAGDDGHLVLPEGRWARRRPRRQAWKQAERQRRAEAKGQVRFPIFTRSVLVWLFIFAVAGVAFGASAAFWWSHFNSEVEAIRGETSAFTQQVQGAASAVEGQRQAALDEIDAALEEARLLSEPVMAPTIAAQAAPSVFLVETRDEEGALAVGSAFVVASDPEAGSSYLLTSLAVVASSTTAPGPDIRLRQGDTELAAELWAWDEATDLALLVVEVPDLPALDWVGEDVAGSALGRTIFPVAGLGGQGATAIPGQVVDASMAGLQVTAPIGTAYRGGPILTVDGKVLAVATTALQPLGFDPGEVRFVPPIGAACAVVLDCGAATPVPPADPTQPAAGDPAPTAGGPEPSGGASGEPTAGPAASPGGEPARATTGTD